MNGFLLDTNVISELVKPEPDGNVLRWIGETDDTRRYEADTHDGRLLDIIVLDRDRQAVGLVYRLYRSGW